MSAALLDVNVLLALSWDQHVHHRRAHERFSEVERWHTTAVTEAALLRLLLNEAVVGRIVSVQEAIDHLRALRRVQGWSWLPDTLSPTDWTIGVHVLKGYRQVTDLQLVNLAASCGAVLATFDAKLVSMLPRADRRHLNLWE